MRQSTIHLRNVILIYAFISALLWPSCKETPPCVVPCETIAAVDPEAYEYFLFNEGSWVEYELIDSSIVDTLTLIKNDKWYSDYQCIDYDSYCQYVYDVRFEHSHNGYYPKISYGSKLLSEEHYEISLFGDRWVVLKSSQNGTSATNGQIFNFPVYAGETFGVGYTVTDTSQSISTTVGTLTTIEVTRTTPPQNFTPFACKSMNYAKGIGLVQFEMYNGHVWRIKSYKIL